MLGAWCGKKRPRQKSGHLEDRTLSDVAEEKTFDWWSKGRVTSEIDVSPPKKKKKIYSTDSSKVNEKMKVVIAVFQVTERLQVLMCK